MEIDIYNDFKTKDQIYSIRIPYSDLLLKLGPEIIKETCIEMKTKMTDKILEEHGERLVNEILKSIPTKSIAKLITKELKDGIKNKITKS